MKRFWSLYWKNLRKNVLPYCVVTLLLCVGLGFPFVVWFLVCKLTQEPLILFPAFIGSGTLSFALVGQFIETMAEMES